MSQVQFTLAASKGGESVSGAQARYGAQPIPETLKSNSVIDALLSHRSVRAFTDAPVPEGALEAAVAAAQSASTSSNLQAWSVIAVRERATKSALATVAGGQRHVVEAPLMLVWVADLSRLATLGERVGGTVEGLDFLEMFLVGAIDAALAAQNAAIALESLGLGIVYIGGLRNDPEKVAELLGLPPRAVAVFGMCVGHPDPARPAQVKPRLSQGLVLHQERYDAAVPEAAVAGYDAAMTAFQEAEGMRPAGWSGVVVQRVAGPAALTGRDRLRDALKRLGFPLR